MRGGNAMSPIEMRMLLVRVLQGVEETIVRISGWTIVGFSGAFMLTLIAATFVVLGFDEPAIRLLVRNTARVSVTIFLLAFIASALHTRLHARWTGYLLKNRRYIGVSFALAHGVHLLLLVVLFVKFPHPFTDALKPVTLIGGGLAYAFIALMTLTSFDATAAMIGPRAWRILHTAGIYYIWILFAQSYFPRAWNNAWYAPFAMALLAAMLLRIFLWASRRRKTNVSGAIDAIENA